RPEEQHPAQHRPGAQHLPYRVHGEHPRAQPPPGHLGRRHLRRRRGNLGHVASPGVAAVVLVSCATSWLAVSLSRPCTLIGPAADAVVTVTLASPNSRSSTPNSLSTVWIREIGAIRRSWVNQPVCVYTAWSVLSQRCTRYRHWGITIRCSTASTPVATSATSRRGTSEPAPISQTTSAPASTSQPIAARTVQYTMARRLTRCAGARRATGSAVTSAALPLRAGQVDVRLDTARGPAPADQQLAGSQREAALRAERGERDLRRVRAGLGQHAVVVPAIGGGDHPPTGHRTGAPGQLGGQLSRVA